MTARIAFFIALPAAIILGACATRSVETRILNASGVEVFLRHRLDEGQEVVLGYTHPQTISAERLSVILSQIEIESPRRRGFLGRKTESQRQAAISIPLLKPVTGALAEAFAQAGPNQEIVLRAVHERRKVGIFMRKFATGFTVFAKDDTLHLKFAFVDWEVPLVDDDEEEERLPMPGRGESVMALRVLPIGDMQMISSREVAVRWRSASFDHPEIRASEPALSPHLGSETSRELADLEQARESGEISESYYQRKRGELLRRGDSR